MEGDIVVLTDVFKFEQTNVTADGKVVGSLKPTGIRPLFTPRLEAAGVKLGAEVFGANISEILGKGQRR
jgi:pilus assembly protein CpaF